MLVLGNAEGDAAADGSGSGVAGTYDPETGVVTMAMLVPRNFRRHCNTD